MHNIDAVPIGLDGNRHLLRIRKGDACISLADQFTSWPVDEEIAFLGIGIHIQGFTEMIGMRTRNAARGFSSTSGNALLLHF